ncbi:MAG: undecaprenyl-diphosphate phosphatase [candidate division Zixibacteria bacterium]|nr:undecaprenyl-diphosphate phosphatase [candidate division Zixibacteria bacterium]
MTILQAIIIGAIQGLTEFLPISSSGHLVIGQSLLGLKTAGVTFEIWLHLGTLAAVLIYFRSRIIRLIQSLWSGREGAVERTTVWALILGTLPAVVIGFTLKSAIETAFSSPKFTAAMLVVTGVILLSTLLAKNKGFLVSPLRGLIIGVAQAVAILPGISRSGSTISAAMFLGVDPPKAAEFSFLLSIPAIAGAFLLDAVSAEGGILPAGDFGGYLIGTAISFLLGLLSIHYLLKIIRKGSFHLFGIYCLVVGAVSYVFLP